MVVDIEIEHNWGEVDKGVPEAKELGRRLAVCNMDWDRIKARDLYVLFSSFKPTGGIIHSVTVSTCRIVILVYTSSIPDCFC